MTQQLGFIAQDVRTVIPEAVVANKGSGMLGLKTNFILPYLVNAIKELDYNNKRKEIENTILRTQLKAMESRMQRIELALGKKQVKSVLIAAVEVKTDATEKKGILRRFFEYVY